MKSNFPFYPPRPTGGPFSMPTFQRLSSTHLVQPKLNGGRVLCSVTDEMVKFANRHGSLYKFSVKSPSDQHPTRTCSTVKSKTGPTIFLSLSCSMARTCAKSARLCGPAVLRNSARKQASCGCSMRPSRTGWRAGVQIIPDGRVSC